MLDSDCFSLCVKIVGHEIIAVENEDPDDVVVIDEKVAVNGKGKVIMFLKVVVKLVIQSAFTFRQFYVVFIIKFDVKWTSEFLTNFKFPLPTIYRNLC